MVISNAPQFWLRVKKEYIFDNFDSLLEYLRAYKYNPSGNNSDYDSTMNAMRELSDDFCDQIEATPFYKQADLSHDHDEVVKLLLATVLAANKCGRTAHRVVCSLVNLFVKERVKINEEDVFRFYDIVINCIRGRKIASTGFSWEDLLRRPFSIDMVALKMLSIKFEKSAEPLPSVYLENNGLFVVPSATLPVFAPMNLYTYKKGNRQTQIALQHFLDVEVTRKDYERIRDVDTLNKVCNNIFLAQSQAKKSIAVSLLDYTDDDAFIVKIIEINGYKVVGKTIDPRYNSLKGNIWINLSHISLNQVMLQDVLDVGDYITVGLCHGKGNCIFEISDIFEDFYRKYAARQASAVCEAICVGEYPKGLDFISSDGVKIGVDNSKIASLSDEDRTALQEAKDSGIPVKLRYYANPPDINKDNFFVYADFSEGMVKLCPEDTFTAREANASMLMRFIRSAADEAGEILASQGVSYREGDRRCFCPLLSILYLSLNDFASSSRIKVEYAAVLGMLSRVMGNDDDLAYADHLNKYFFALLQFAQNKPLRPISHDVRLQSEAEVDMREKIIEKLADYNPGRSAQPEEAGKGKNSVDENLLEKVGTLVDASNDLADIIEDSELNNIRQSIAKILDVDDEYVSILDDRTYYGRENINLEFKTTIVFPPANRRRIASAYADPEVQKWAIVKSVCGFLNSRGGGELLLGVNNAGYAVGFEEDIKALLARKLIISDDEDAYRTYVQNILDYSFREYGEKGYNTDVARTCISYLFEENPEGKTILRIKVKPYMKNLVELAADPLPEGVESSYIRRNGRTLYVSDAMKRDILRYKNAAR